MPARAFVVSGPSRFELQEFPLPAVGPDSALLRVLRAGVDGTDVTYLRGDATREVTYPFIAGDEIVGRIDAVGTRAARRWGVAEGDLVAVDPHLACGACAACAGGRAQFCAEGRGFGVRISAAEPPHLWGAFAEYLFLPPTATVVALGDLTPDVGILVPSMLANAIRWVVGVGGVRPGDEVLILGAGQQALGCTLVAADAGASRVVVCGLAGDEARLAMAARLGATETVVGVAGVRGADVVIDVTGSPLGLSTALKTVGRGGRVVVAGLSRSTVPIAPDRLVWDEVSILGAYSHDRASFERAIRLAHKRADVLGEVISHRYPLEETAAAVASLTTVPRPVKVVIEP